MGYKLEIEIPGLPKTTNSGGRAHWAVKVKEAEKWKWGVAVKSIGLTPKSPLRSAKLTLTRFSSTRPDFDGLVSSFKHVLDGLVKAGIISDDDFEVIGNPTYLWEKAPAKNGKIRVQVEEVVFG